LIFSEDVFIISLIGLIDLESLLVLDSLTIGLGSSKVLEVSKVPDMEMIRTLAYFNT